MQKFNLGAKVTIKGHIDPNHNGKTGMICLSYLIERGNCFTKKEDLISFILRGVPEEWDSDLRIGHVVYVGNERIQCDEDWLELV